MIEFLLGFVLAFLSIFAVRKLILPESFIKSHSVGKIIYRQSHIFEVAMAPYLVPSQFSKITQSTEHDLKNKIRVVFTDNRAYWIKNNTLYQADLVNGQVDDSTTKVVDTMTMDRVELDKMILIVQKLTEGMQNDGGSSGI